MHATRTFLHFARATTAILHLALAAALVVGAAALSEAQATTPAPRTTQPYPLMPGIQLTAVQFGQLQALDALHRQALQDLKQDNAGVTDTVVLNQKRRDIRQKRQDAVRKVLTAPQQLIFDQAQDNMRARFEQHRAGGRP